MKVPLDKVPASIFLLSPDRIIRDINRRGLLMFGYETAEELVGQSTRILYPDEKEFLRVQPIFAKDFGDAPTVLEDVPVVRKNGERIWADLSASRVRVEGEDLFVVTVLDATERHRLIEDQRKVRKDLDSQIRFYRALTDINALVLEPVPEETLLTETVRIMIGRAGFTAVGFYFPNGTALRLGTHHITDPQTNPDRHPLSFSLDPASPDREAATVRCFRERIPVFIDDLDAYYHRIEGAESRASDYRTLSFRSSGVCPIFRGGQIAGVFAAASDRTNFFTPGIRDLLVEIAQVLSTTLDHIDNEKARRSSETYLKALLDNVLAGVFLVTPGRVIRDVNRRGLLMLGYETAEELVGQSSRLIYPDEKEFLRIQPIFAKDLGDAPTVSEDVPLVRKNGERIWADSSAHRVRVGEEDLFVVTVHDATARHRQTERLARLSTFNVLLAQASEIWATATDESSFLRDIAALALEKTDVCLVWIGTPGEDETFEFRAVAGDEGVLADFGPISCRADSPRGLGPAARAWRTRNPQYKGEFFRDEEEENASSRPIWAAGARQHGIRSVAALPLFRGESLWGIITFYHHERNFFDPEVRSLLEELARSVSRGLARIDLLLREQSLAQTQKTLLDALPDGVWLKDGNGAWRIVNPAGLALFGLSGRTDWIGKTERELARINPPFAAAHLGCLTTDEESWSRGSSTDATEPVVAPDGAIHLIESRKIPLFNEDGSRKSLVVIGRDVTERIRAEEALQRYRHIFENAKEGILLTDENRNVVDVNPAFTATTGYTRDEAIGRNPNMLQSGRQDRRFYESMWATIDRDGFWEGEIWNRKKSGEIYCEWLGISALKKDEKIVGYLGIFSDITRRKEAEDRIVHMAFHDGLTGLPNFRSFRERIGEVLERRSREPDLRFAVGILDLDGFKEVNDRMGHPAGDELLVQVSLRIKGVVRSTDTLSRLGGDEFGLLLVGPDLDDGIFDRIVSALSKPFDIAGERVEISGSLGATFSPPDRGEVDPLLSHASLALNRVKAREGNGWTPFQEEMEEALENRHRIRNELVRALSEKELVLHYQPQVDMVSGAVTGVEALVRWNHPERGLLFPDAFINVAERSDLISSLGRSVMEEALAQQERWKTGGLDLRVSVNIGARHFLSDNFLADLDAALSRHCRKGICPVTLEIEVTETEALKDLSKAQKIIKRCLETGIVVSLDDFGTGQASLTSLQRLSVGEIKIDKGFVGKIQYSDKDRAIVSSLVVVGRMMGIDVVAEGIETEEDGLLLIGMGCRVAQGYAIAKPMPAEAVPAWIANWTPFDSWKKGATPGDPARWIPGEEKK